MMLRRTDLLSVGVLFIVTILLSACAVGPDSDLHKVSVDHASASVLVEVLYHKPRRPYRVVGRLHIQGVMGQSEAQLLAALQKRASALGAQAIIVQQQGATEPPSLQYNPAGGQFSMQPTQTIPAFAALAIRFTGSQASDRTR